MLHPLHPPSCTHPPPSPAFTTVDGADGQDVEDGLDGQSVSDGQDVEDNQAQTETPEHGNLYTPVNRTLGQRLNSNSCVAFDQKIVIIIMNRFFL